jgi:addiction module HigA family antidote
MLPTHRIPTHPGQVLDEEFLQPLGLTHAAFAQHVRVPEERIKEIVRGEQPVTAEVAWLFAMAFGTTPEYWLALQSQRDLAETRPTESLAPLVVA